MGKCPFSKKAVRLVALKELIKQSSWLDSEVIHYARHLKCLDGKTCLQPRLGQTVCDIYYDDIYYTDL